MTKLITVMFRLDFKVIVKSNMLQAKLIMYLHTGDGDVIVTAEEPIDILKLPSDR